MGITSEAVLRPKYTPQPSYRGPIGLGQYKSRGKYCSPHTDSSVFLILARDCIFNTTFTSRIRIYEIFYLGLAIYILEPYKNFQIISIKKFP